MIKRGKKGQFYIIAAIIIAVVLLGLFATTNYVRIKPKDIKFYDLGQELNIESGYVIDHGIYDPEQDVDELIEQWAEEFVSYSGESDWVFVYGDKDSMTILTFASETSGGVGVYIGGEFMGLLVPGTQDYKEEYDIQEGEDIIVEIGGNEYSFGLNPGQNFYFVISQEEYVVTGD